MSFLFNTFPAPQSTEQPGSLHWRDMPQRYPVRDLVVVIAAGVIVFVLSGYLGYATNHPTLIDRFLGEPVFLYPWICFILFLILVRHPSIKEHAAVPLLTFTTSVILVGFFFADRLFNSSRIYNALIALLRQILPTLTGGRLLFNLLNFGVLLWWLVTVLLSWWRRYGPRAPWAAAPASGPDAGPDASVTNLARFSTLRGLQDAMHGELVSGDLLAGAAIAGFFAVLFSPSIYGVLQALAPHSSGTSGGIAIAARSGALPPAPVVPPCPITLPIYACPPPDPIHPPPYVTLSFVDARIAFVLAAIGGLWLISISAIKAFRSVTIDRLFVELVRTLLAALGRLVGLRLLSLVKIFWLPAILFAPVAAVFASQFIWCNLHFLGNDTLPGYCQLGTGIAFAPVPTVIAAVLLAAILSAVALIPRQMGGRPLDLLAQVSGVFVFILTIAIVFEFAQPQAPGTGFDTGDRLVLSAIGWLLIAMLVLIWGLGLWVGRWDVITQSLIFLAFVGEIVVAIFWVFSVTLWGADTLFNVGSGRHHPFQINDSTWFSLVAFVATAIWVMLGRPFGARPKNSGPTPIDGTPRGSEPAAVAPPTGQPARDA